MRVAFSGDAMVWGLGFRVEGLGLHIFVAAGFSQDGKTLLHLR